MLLHVNNSVSVERLVDAIWDEETPQTARNQVQRCIHRLRGRFVDAGLPFIVTEPGGYRAEIDPRDLDLLEFRRLVGEARAAAAGGRRGEAVASYRAALALWRGPAFADVDSNLVRHAAVALDEERAQTTEECIANELADGGAGELVAELTDLVAQHPHREGLHRARMLALYRAGRQGEALVAYRRLRRLLHDDLGIEPGDDTQELHRAILNRDSSLEAARPTPSSLQPPTPRELPADVSGFTGRADALKALDELLPDGSATGQPAVISAIAGTAGVGKTALAVHWAHHVANRFPHGQLYLNLRGYAAGAPVRPIEALSTLLRTLGMPSEQIPAEEAEASARFRSLLSDRRVLVVLDNARSADQVRPLLPGSPGCLALVTSRDRLAGLVARDGARRLTLDVLTADEAYTLVTHLLGAERVQAEPEAVAELARACAFLPLALRIAVAIIQERPDRSVNRLATDMAAGPLLDALEIPDDEASAVRAAFDLSYLGIPEPAQRMFRLLGLVPGPDVTPPAAAALAGVPEGEARRLLARLASAHLIDEHAPDRYTFHDLLREYATHRTKHEDSDASRAAALARLLGWYLSTAEEASQLIRPHGPRLPLPPDQRPQAPPPHTDQHWAVALMDAERQNLVAAIHHVAERGPRQYAWLLADRLRPYFMLRMGADGLIVGRTSVAAAEVEGNPHGQAAAHLFLANAEFFIGDRQRAMEHFNRTSQLAGQARWLRGQAAAENNLASVHIEAGRLRQAVSHINQALAINQRMGNRDSVAYNVGNLGFVLCELGSLQEAYHRFERARSIHRDTNNLNGVAVGCVNLGRAAWLLRRLPQARSLLGQGLHLHRETGSRGGTVNAQRILAWVLCDAGQPSDALHVAENATHLVRDSGDSGEESFVMNALATACRMLGRLDDAVSHYERALVIGERQRYASAEALIGLAISRHGLGHNQQALSDALRALNIARETGYGVLEGQALTVIAGMRFSLHESREGEDLAYQALGSHRTTGHRLGEARTLAVLGHIRHAIGDDPTARRHWRDARDLFDEIGAPVPADVTEHLHDPT
jgi:DNA-binding SARP family transcriptional activator